MSAPAQVGAEDAVDCGPVLPQQVPMVVLERQHPQQGSWDLQGLRRLPGEWQAIGLHDLHSTAGSATLQLVLAWPVLPSWGCVDLGNFTLKPG